jgi:purine catabolism regulator
MWVGIWLRDEAWGRVHVLETEDGGLGEITELVLDRAGAAIGLALLSQRDANQLAERAGSALVADLLAERHGSISEFLRRARSLGADLTHGRLAALVIEPTTLTELVKREGLSERDRQRIRLSIVSEIRRAAHERECSTLVGFDGDRVLAIIAITGRRPVRRTLEEIVDAARVRIQDSEKSLTIIAGASREVGPNSLRSALEEASEAFSFGQRRSDADVLYHFADLGIYPLLLRLAEGPELARFVESELSPLLEHDARRSAKLVPTLRAYLEHAGRKADAVRALGIQRRTLYDRLERISKILDRDLDEQDTRTRLTLALQALDLLHNRGIGGV